MALTRHFAAAPHRGRLFFATGQGRLQKKSLALPQWDAAGGHQCLDSFRRRIRTFVGQNHPSDEKTSKPPPPFASLYQQTKTIQIQSEKRIIQTLRTQSANILRKTKNQDYEKPLNPSN
jgi:hypothetical protein